MKNHHHHPHTIAALAVAGLTVTLAFGPQAVAETPVAPPAPAGAIGAPPPPPLEGGPSGERPAPPRPEVGPEAAPAVDPQTALDAVKTAGDVLASIAPGEVWSRTAPRGEQQVQATLVYQNRTVARLDFDPATGLPMARGQRPPAPGGPVPPSPAASLGRVKGQLAATLKGLSVGQGAEIMGREGFWKVPLIYQNRVVGELRLAADGSKIIEDFSAARDAAIYAR